MKRSRSPSPSKSTNAGMALKLTLLIPKGLMLAAAYEGLASVSNSWLTCAGAVASLPAASVTPVLLTSTVRLPSSYASGITSSV